MDQVNRAKVMWYNWERKEKELLEIGELVDEHPREITRQKYEYLRQGLYRLSVNPSRAEKMYLEMIRTICDKLAVQLYPSIFQRLFLQAKAALLDMPKAVVDQQRIKAGNVAALNALLKTRGLTGFGGKLEDHLDYEREKVYLSSGGQMEEIFFYKLEVELIKDGLGLYQISDVEAHKQCWGDPAANISITFDREYPLSAQQMVNFLDGRAVCCLNEPSSELKSETWLKLGQNVEGIPVILPFKADYGFDLKKVLAELANETGLSKFHAPVVMANLQNGFQFEICGHHPKDKPFLIEADPGQRTLKFRKVSQEEISRSELMESLRHVVPNVNPGQELGKQQESDISKQGPGLEI